MQKQSLIFKKEVLESFFFLSLLLNMLKSFKINYRMSAIITSFLKPTSSFSMRFFQKILSLYMVSIQERFVIKSGL